MAAVRPAIHLPPLFRFPEPSVIIEVFQFQTQEQGIEHLGKVRWAGEPSCPYCGSLGVGRDASNNRSMACGQCRDYTRAFAVTIRTLFRGTHIALRYWFLVLARMLNAKKSVNAYQVARDLGTRRSTVWGMMQRIRTAMAAHPDQERLLHGIAEADETYVGGKPRNGNKRDDDDVLAKRRRVTSKVPVIGAVESRGRVVARVANPGDLHAKGIGIFNARFVDKVSSILTTDEYVGYNRVSESMLHAVICHSEAYANGAINATSVESFCAIIKRAGHVTHYHFSRRCMPPHIAESCYNYNRRQSATVFSHSMRMLVGTVA